MFTAKFGEVQKFISLTNHCWEGMTISANLKSFKSLPADVQEIITRNINECGLKQRKEMEQLNSSVASKLKTMGLVFNEVNTQPFREKLKTSGYYKEWRSKIGDQAWTALEKVVGSLSLDLIGGARCSSRRT
jgi:TRAP-type C4-dicarboxylate transport system substrate-binding protein